MPANFDSQPTVIPKLHSTATTSSSSSLWLEQMFCSRIFLLGSYLARVRDNKQKRRGQKVHYTPLFQSRGVSAPHKDLDLWPLWASVPDSWATEGPDPIYLCCLWVRRMHMCVYILSLMLSVYLCVCIYIQYVHTVTVLLVSDVQHVAVLLHMAMT